MVEMLIDIVNIPARLIAANNLNSRQLESRGWDNNTSMYSISYIEAAICTQKEGQEMMDWSTSTMVGRGMGIDVAWGNTSKFSIVITQHRNRKVEVFYASTFEKPRMNEIINHIMRLKRRHHITKIYCDGANPEVIRELKSKTGEYHDYYGRLTEEQVWALRSSNSW